MNVDPSRRMIACAGLGPRPSIHIGGRKLLSAMRAEQKEI